MITAVPESTQPRRRRRYVVMMVVRIAAVPGVLLLPVPVGVQVALVMAAALLQFGAVVSANEPSGARPYSGNGENDRRLVTGNELEEPERRAP